MKSIWKAAVTAILLCSFFELGCGDAYRPIATPIIQPGGDPGFTDTVGVIQSASSTDNGTLTQIDVSGDTNMAEKPIGAGATMGALDSTASNIFIPNPNTGTVTVTPTSTSVFAVTTITLLANSRPEFATSTKSGVMYVANSNPTPDACPSSGSVEVLDATSMTQTSSICVSGHPTYLVQSGDTTKLFAVSPAENRVTIIDATLSAANIDVTVGTNPISATLSGDQTLLYVLNQGSSDISVINVATAAVVATVPTGGTGSAFMVRDKRLNRLYVTNTTSNTITAIDLTNAAAPTVIGTVSVGPAPVQLTALQDGSRVYVLNSANATVSELSAANLSLLKTITVNSTAGATGQSITSARDSSKVYVATSDPTNTSNGVAIIRTSDDSLATKINSPQLVKTCDPTTSTCPRLTPKNVFTRAN